MRKAHIYLCNYIDIFEQRCDEMVYYSNVPPSKFKFYKHEPEYYPIIKKGMGNLFFDIMEFIGDNGKKYELHFIDGPNPNKCKKYKDGTIGHSFQRTEKHSKNFQKNLSTLVSKSCDVFKKKNDWLTYETIENDKGIEFHVCLFRP